MLRVFYIYYILVVFVDEMMCCGQRRNESEEHPPRCSHCGVLSCSFLANFVLSVGFLPDVLSVGGSTLSCF